jgi:hypothetical protein
MGRGVRLRKANSRHRAWTGEILKNRIFQLIVLFAVLAAIAAIVTGLDLSIRLTEK